MEKCLVAERIKEVRGKIPNYLACSTAFTTAYTKAEFKAGALVCPSEGDVGTIGDYILNTCFANLREMLSGGTPAACESGAFPATGQTTCWNQVGDVISCVGTGHDGAIQAGAVLSYTDNGDGTITDNATGLMWEKKSSDNTIHFSGNAYTWENVFTQHIAVLNTVPCFAGYCDWRLPNVKELQSIVNYENSEPSTSVAFNTGCVAGCTVLTCSCTGTGSPSRYWTSTTSAGFPTNAWRVHFDFGDAAMADKGFTSKARAVRGGL
jgi:hypothetical protein